MLELVKKAAVENSSHGNSCQSQFERLGLDEPVVRSSYHLFIYVYFVAVRQETDPFFGGRDFFFTFVDN